MTRPSNTGSLPSRCAADNVSSLNCCCTSAVARTWLAVDGACRQAHRTVGGDAEAGSGQSGGEQRQGGRTPCSQASWRPQLVPGSQGDLPKPGCSATVRRSTLTLELEVPASVGAVESLLLRFPVNFLSVSIGRSSLPLRHPHRTPGEAGGRGRCSASRNAQRARLWTGLNSLGRSRTEGTGAAMRVGAGKQARHGKRNEAACSAGPIDDIHWRAASLCRSGFTDSTSLFLLIAQTSNSAR